MPGCQWEVVYLQDPAKGAGVDAELSQASHWGIDMLNGYTWHSAAHCRQKADWVSLLHQLQPNVLISNGYQHDYAPAMAAATQLGIPMALRIDSVLWGRSAASLWVRKLLMRHRYRSFRWLLTTGKAGFEYLDYIGIPRRQQGWFPYCVDHAFFARENNGEAIEKLKGQLGHLINGRKLVLSVCKFIDRENPKELLEAFIALGDTGLVLVMIGDGPQANQLRAMAALHPNLTILFPGYIPYPQLPAWYGIADVFVHPARNEPWGVSVQEAIAAGCAVVCSDKVGSGYDLIQTGANGYQYEEGKVSDLAGKISAALSLEKHNVSIANQNILAHWNYESVWRSVRQHVDPRESNEH